jgi:hypothetical protein
MVMKRTCRQIKANGERCRAAPLRDSEYCFMHDPSREQERDEARRLGGLRRRREKSVALVYQWLGLRSVQQIRRVLEVAVVDTLAQDNSPARSRALAYLASLALKALEVGELEERVAALEDALQDQRSGRGVR